MNERLPPLLSEYVKGFSRICSFDVVWNAYENEQERSERLIAARWWLQRKLWLYYPLNHLQKIELNKILWQLCQENAIEAEMAIVSLINLEEWKSS